VYYNWWDGQLGVLLYKLRIKTNTLPIFLNYNIEQYSSDFTYAGYHTAFGDPAQVYISAGFFDEGIFSYGGDIVFLSHEMGETTDDPFVDNIVPPWNNPQKSGQLQRSARSRRSRIRPGYRTGSFERIHLSSRGPRVSILVFGRRAVHISERLVHFW